MFFFRCNDWLAICESVSLFLALSCFLPNEDGKWIISVTQKLLVVYAIQVCFLHAEFGIVEHRFS